jgi:hypothetical protein
LLPYLSSLRLRLFRWFYVFCPSSLFLFVTPSYSVK